jgi:hypothetical protein
MRSNGVLPSRERDLDGSCSSLGLAGLPPVEARRDPPHQVIDQGLVRGMVYRGTCGAGGPGESSALADCLGTLRMPVSCRTRQWRLLLTLSYFKVGWVRRLRSALILPSLPASSVWNLTADPHQLVSNVPVACHSAPPFWHADGSPRSSLDTHGLCSYV